MKYVDFSHKRQSHKKYTLFDSMSVVKKWTQLIYGLEVKTVITVGSGSDWEGKMEVSGAAATFSFLAWALVTLVCSLCESVLGGTFMTYTLFLHVHHTLIKRKNKTEVV